MLTVRQCADGTALVSASVSATNSQAVSVSAEGAVSLGGDWPLRDLVVHTLVRNTLV